ncbi:MAG: GWxTD domain-containing protein [Candidatus Krumholzibacteria bacterium]|nr:GWxTD domain-containing protein [Candidatus Krumholzibacteria bacterium]
MSTRRVRCILSRIVIAALLLLPGPASRAEGSAPPLDEIPLYERLDRYERRRYEGLRYLMNDHRKYQYLNLPTREERDEWVIRFWRMMDPTPATRTNERREEHERRVEAARDRYANKGFPGWDHRGETLIRFGEPDVITPISPHMTCAESPKEDFDLKMNGEVWTYERLGMVVPFEQVKLDGTYNYYMEIRTATRQDQWYTAKDSYIQGGGSNLFACEDFLDLMERWAYDPENIYSLYFAAVPELLTFYSHLEHNRCVHSADLDLVPLLCYFDVTAFRGGPGKIRADVNFEIPARQLAFRQDLSGWHAKFEIRVAAYDLDMNEVIAVSRKADLFRREPILEDSLWLCPAQLNLAMAPGYYRWGIEVIDRAGGKHGCYRFSRLLEPLGEGLSLSDILFASSVSDAGEADAFVRGTLRVVPHPMHAYRKPHPVRLYFEIYDLDTDPQGFAFYSIEYRIEAKKRHRVGPVLRKQGTVISPRFETSAYGATQSERLEIDTDRLRKGSYRLFVTVMDRRTRKSVERVANFSILDE